MNSKYLLFQLFFIASIFVSLFIKQNSFFKDTFGLFAFFIWLVDFS